MDRFPAHPAGRRRLALALGVAAVVVAVDQVTKSIALAHLHGPVHLVGPLGLALAFNSGAAFSLFTGATAGIVVVAVALIAVLGLLAWRGQGARMAVALGLLLGGALGNLADRLFRAHHGDVVDFITLTHWPTFNVADFCITLGAILTVVFVLWRPRPADR